MEDDLLWKMTFDGRQPSMEDNLRWKTTFDGGQPLMEDDFQWKMTISGRRHLLERFRDSALPYTAVAVIFLVVVVVVTGVKQSQLLVPRLKSGLWTGV